MIVGTIFGAALNDREHHRHMAAAFIEPPYKQPPNKPVLYIKPRACLMGDSAIIPIPPDLEQIEVAATLGLLIGRDAHRIPQDSALAYICGICLALDASEPCDSFYRPPVRQRCRDGFLRLGRLAPFNAKVMNNPIETFADDRKVHSWSTERLLRDAATLIADISVFMTLAAGDLLLVGLAYDAPRSRPGCRIIARCGNLPGLSVSLQVESVA
ncbi:MAG TPA: fumarylacetoacetate hydrolase family protein [Rhizomicrobium sp.]|nr:fumarylacetoacetate hydrolase family protein [Rhizomicrobium sp.]